MTNRRILIVDDEPYNLDYLQQELEDSHYEIMTASNGREAIETIHSTSPDLILLDIMMPVMDGFEVLSYLKAVPVTRDIPIIIISALSDLKNVVKGIQLGAEDYLPKPFEPVLLHARISSCLEKKRLRDIQQLYLKSLEREMEIARKIQMDFLPAELPKVEGWNIATWFKAAREVTGDFYDAFLLPDGNLVCVVGDVCDKGVGAALYMTLFRSLIRATASSDVSCSGLDMEALTPTERLRRIVSFTNNYIFENHNQASMFAAVFLVIFNVDNGLLTYANCGNEPALLYRKNCSMIELKPTGPVIGVIQDAQFGIREIGMEKDDLLLAFTDGVPDSKNESEEFLGRAGFIHSMQDCESDPRILLEHIQSKISQFIGTANQYDDITLLAVKRI